MFRFHTGSIKRANEGIDRPPARSVFRFHTGSIKRPPAMGSALPLVYDGFDSILVRLKDNEDN